MILVAPALRPGAARAGDPAIVADVPAPFFWDSQTHQRAGATADRFELDDPSRMVGVSARHHLSYVAGGERHQLHDHNATTTTLADSDIAKSENVAWHVARSIVAGNVADADVPCWARARTGNADGTSAGLLYALADLDLLTPGPLAGDLRVAGTGSIGSEGTVTAVRMVDAKRAAARLAAADVLFAPDFPAGSGTVTSVRSHLGDPGPDRPIGEWLNTDGFEATGRTAATLPGTVALVRIDDVGEALAWICGRTHLPTTCALADDAASTPLTLARPGLEMTPRASGGQPTKWQ